MIEIVDDFAMPLARLLPDFLAFVAHDWVQPLNTLALVAQCFSDDYFDGELSDAKVDRFREDCMTQVGRIAGSINDLRRVFSAEPQSGGVELRRLVEQIVKIVSPRMHSINVDVIFKAPDDDLRAGVSPALGALLVSLMGRIYTVLKAGKQPVQIDIEIDCHAEKPRIQINWCRSAPLSESRLPVACPSLTRAFKQAGWSLTGIQNEQSRHEKLILRPLEKEFQP